VNAASATTRFASVVLDVDSTLTAVEGIEWLGARRSPEVSREVSEMTQQAMTGATPLQDVYAARLALVRPGRDEIAALADAYRRGTMPGAAEAIAGLRAAGVGICVISGGIREAVVPFAASLGVGQDEVHAVSVHFTPDGRYAGFDTASPLTRRGGKSTVVLGPVRACVGGGRWKHGCRTQDHEGRGPVRGQRIRRVRRRCGATVGCRCCGLRDQSL